MFSGEISAKDMSQKEIEQALSLMKKKYAALLDADERPPRELLVLPECTIRQ